MQSALRKAPNCYAYSATILKILFDAKKSLTIREIESDYYELEDEEINIKLNVSQLCKTGLIKNLGHCMKDRFGFMHGNSCHYCLTPAGFEAVRFYRGVDVAA